MTSYATDSPYGRALTLRQLCAIYGRSAEVVKGELNRQRRAGHALFRVPRDWQAEALSRVDEFLSGAGEKDSLADLVKWAEKRHSREVAERIDNVWAPPTPVFTQA